MIGRATGRPRGSPNTHQPKPADQAGGRATVGARVDDAGKGGPLGSPAGWGGGRVSPRFESDEQDAGDPKGPPNPSSAALAPTDGDGLVLG